MMDQELINYWPYFYAFIAGVFVTVASVVIYMSLNIKIPNSNLPIKFHSDCPGPQNLTLTFKGTKIEDSNQKVFHKNGNGKNGNIVYYYCQKYHYKNMPLTGKCRAHFNLDIINNVVVKHENLINHNHP